MQNIERIFAVGKGNYLFSLRYFDGEYDHDGEHELTKHDRLWQDPEYLEDFYEKHRNDVRSQFHGRQTFIHFIQRTHQDSFEMIKALSEAADDDDPTRLNALFRPLDNRPHPKQNYEQLKAKGLQPKSWLRLYALQTRDDKIYIIGGAIKLVHRMDEREHLRTELARLISVRKELSAHIREGRLGELILPT